MRPRYAFWLIFLLWSAAIFGLLTWTKFVTPFSQISPDFNLIEQIFYTLVLSPFPAFIVFWSMKKSQDALAFHRLLINGAAMGLVIFVIQIMLFILLHKSTNMNLPLGSNLYDTALAKQVAVYSQIPMLSHFLAVFLFAAAFVSCMVSPGGSVGRTVAIGIALYVPYIAGFVLCHSLWQGHLDSLLMPPYKLDLWMLFVHWLPTLYFLALTYLCGVIRRK